MENNIEEKKNLFIPESELMKITNSKNNKIYIKISKIILNKFSKVIISSLGKASEKAVQISEDLVR